jgi:uncharacterized protein YrrD
MSDKSNLENNLSKVEKHLNDAGRQAVSKAEATIVEAVYWLHQTTAALKQSYDEKIVQLEAELQSAHEKIASLTSASTNSIIEDLTYTSNKLIVSEPITTSSSVEEIDSKSSNILKDEEITGHIEPVLVVEKSEKIEPITTSSSVEEIDSKSSNILKDEEITGHIEPVLVVEKSEKIEPIVMSAPVKVKSTVEKIEKKTQVSATKAPTLANAKKNKNI